MRRLSSKKTFFFKHSVPITWLILLALFVYVGLIDCVPGKVNWEKAVPILLMPHNIFFLLMFLFLMVSTTILFRKILDGLADEVWDDGDALIIRHKGVEERIPLHEIMNVSSNPRRDIILWLRTPCAFGQKITFAPLVDRSCAAFRRLFQNSEQMSNMVEELIHRIDGARRGDKR